jgi:hypothetical protein
MDMSAAAPEAPKTKTTNTATVLVLIVAACINFVSEKFWDLYLAR